MASMSMEAGSTFRGTNRTKDMFKGIKGQKDIYGDHIQTDTHMLLCGHQSLTTSDFVSEVSLGYMRPF